MTASRTGVCLLYMGGPRTLDEVEPFLHALFADRDLIRLPGGRRLQGPLGRFIVKRRAPKVRERYAAIGGGSPLVRITERQAALLEAALAPHGAHRVAIGMRYSAPRVDEALAALGEWGAARIVALPLYPHYSSATTGSSFKDLERGLGALPEGRRPEVLRVGSFHDHPLYLDALAATVKDALGPAGPRAPVVFSAHSLPRSLVERGDPYQTHVEATVQGVVSRLGLAEWTLAYQSRSGPVRWLEPDVREVVRSWGGRGVERLVVVPVSFVSDHIETLHELDIELRDLALAHGVRDFVRARALNESPAFIEALAQIVRQAEERGP